MITNKKHLHRLAASGKIVVIGIVTHPITTGFSATFSIFGKMEQGWTFVDVTYVMASRDNVTINVVSATGASSQVAEMVVQEKLDAIDGVNGFEPNLFSHEEDFCVTDIQNAQPEKVFPETDGWIWPVLGQVAIEMRNRQEMSTGLLELACMLREKIIDYVDVAIPAI
jgi:hypothetical protein